MPALSIESFRRPDWEPVPYEGCVNVEGRVLFWDETLGLAVLRFGVRGKINDHDDPHVRASGRRQAGPRSGLALASPTYSPPSQGQSSRLEHRPARTALSRT